MKVKWLKFNTVSVMTGASALIFFLCSSLRHALFQSVAYDLGWYDQVVYLISQGQTPIVSFWGYHVMGDHAAAILYPLALLYKIYPDVHWLFAVQAIALALGCWFTWRLALQAALSEAQAVAMAVVYLLYPLVFNINLFDFHPEVLAIPGLLGAVLAARLGRIAWFIGCLILVLSSKAVLSLTVAAMGFWLLIFDKRRLYGAMVATRTAGGIALGAGVAWFLIATQVVIPWFSGGNEAPAVSRYSYLGSSVLEIIANLFLKPELVLGHLFTLPNLGYLVLLFSPVIWGLSLRYLTPLVVILPTLAMNFLTDLHSQKDLVHQYSLPALPFLLLAVIGTLAQGGGWLRSQRAIILWALIAFVALAKFGYFGSRYLAFLDTWQATTEAVALVETKGSLLTAAHIAPHLTHRPVVKLAISSLDTTELGNFDYALLNVRHPGWQSTPEFTASLVEQLKSLPKFELTYERDEVYLFRKVGSRE